MVEPTWFSPVNIHKEGWGAGWRIKGPCGIVSGLVALRIHYSLVMCIGPCFCGLCEFHGRRGANKSILSVRGDE